MSFTSTPTSSLISRATVRRPARLAREQHALAVADEHDRGRVQVRVVLVAAARALLAPLALDPLRRLAAAWAVAARRFPPERLHGHAAERERIVGQPRVAHRHQRLARQ